MDKMDDEGVNLSEPVHAARKAILDAAPIHVEFTGWSRQSFEEAAADAGVEPALAALAYPRKELDLAIAHHKTGDHELAERLTEETRDIQGFTAKITFAILLRLEIASRQKGMAKTGASFFALPIYAAEGAKLIWHTADTIWATLGDTSDDYNWYTKRATLSAVYSASVLYWLGEDDPAMPRTREFVARRIDDVMRIEKLKADVRKSPLAGIFKRGPGRFLDLIKPPGQGGRQDLPGRWPG